MAAVLGDGGGAGAVNLPEVISEEFLTCKICFEEYKSPKILPCLHTFCQSCLEKHLDRIRQPTGSGDGESAPTPVVLLCPLCRNSTNIPEEGIAGLKTNFFILNLKDVISSPKKRSPPNSPPRNRPSSSSASREQIYGKYNGFCSYHNNSVHLYCADCELPICSVCAQEQVHGSHHVLDLEDAIARDTARVNSILQASRDSVAALSHSYEVLTRGVVDLKYVRDKISNQIKNRTKALQEALNTYQRTILLQLQSEYETEKNRFDEKMEIIEKAKASYNNVHDFADSLLLKGNGLDIVCFRKEVERTLKALTSKSEEFIQTVNPNTQLDFLPGASANEVDWPSVFGTVGTDNDHRGDFVTDGGAQRFLLRCPPPGRRSKNADRTVTERPSTQPTTPTSKEAVSPFHSFTHNVFVLPRSQSTEQLNSRIMARRGSIPQIRTMFTVKEPQRGYATRATTATAESPTTSERPKLSKQYSVPMQKSTLNYVSVSLRPMHVGGATTPDTPPPPGNYADIDPPFHQQVTIPTPPPGDSFVFTSNGRQNRKLLSEAKLAVMFKTRTREDLRLPGLVGVTVTQSGHVAVVDKQNHCVKLFQYHGAFYRKWTGSEHIWGLVALRDGTIAVTDRDIHLIGDDGDLKRTLSVERLIKSARGIAVNRRGELIVCDSANGGVIVLSVMPESGVAQKTLRFRGSTPFKYPAYVTTTQNDDIIVSDTDGHCVSIFSSSGDYIATYGSGQPRMDEGCLDYPCGVTTDRHGHIFICDKNNNRVVAIDTRGNHLGTLVPPSALEEPRDIVVDSYGNLVVVEETGAVKIFKYLQ